jgi:hypothetical protein
MMNYGCGDWQYSNDNYDNGNDDDGDDNETFQQKRQCFKSHTKQTLNIVAWLDLKCWKCWF